MHLSISICLLKIYSLYITIISTPSPPNPAKTATACGTLIKALTETMTTLLRNEKFL